MVNPGTRPLVPNQILDPIEIYCMIGIGDARVERISLAPIHAFEDPTARE
jgi:hypothetical protein